MERIDEAGWERAASHVQLWGEAITAMVRAHLPEARVVRYHTIQSALANTNLKLDLRGEFFVLRVHQRDPEGGLRERHLTELVSPDVPVAEVLYCASAEASVAGVPYSLVRWVDGVLLNEVLANGSAAQQAAAGRACGSLLARPQKHRFSPPGS